MNNEPSFIRLKDTAAEADNLDYGLEQNVLNRQFLQLVTGEVYTQYIYIDRFVNINTLWLVDGNGLKLEDLKYSSIILSDSSRIWLNMSFVITGSYNTCARISINGGDLISNTFYVNNTADNQTSLVTWWHLSNHYNIRYEDVKDNNNDIYLPQQLRLPIYFLESVTEQNSKEYTFNRGTPTNDARGRVVRKYTNKYRVMGSNWINDRIGIVSDSDYIYIDGIKQSVKPFEPSELIEGGDFSINELFAQPLYDDYKPIYLPNDIVNGLFKRHYDPLHYDPLHYNTELT